MPDEFRPLRSSSLPVFRLDGARYSLFYTPEYLSVVESGLADGYEIAIGAPGKSSLPGIAHLRGRARKAAKAWYSAWTSSFYAPQCLTLYLNNTCRLSCAYCYSQPSPVLGKQLSLEAIRRGAEMVARNCAGLKFPMTVIFHGGGEPGLDRKLADQALDEVERLARQHELDLFRYIATNGVLPGERIAWMARRFDRVGLSCDGPPEIQNRQRPQLSGKPTSPYVERAAHILKDWGRAFDVRVTLTPATCRRQVEIAEYICTQLQPQMVHVEPVYRSERPAEQEPFQPETAEEFVANFMEARRFSQNLGISWITSGSRLGWIHGPYCQVYRSVVNLIPGDQMTACFKLSQARDDRRIIGSFDPSSQELRIDGKAFYSFILYQAEISRSCPGCFNRFHCVRACPDVCPIVDKAEPGRLQEGFRCRVQKALAQALLLERADELMANQEFVNGVNAGAVHYAG